jgi:polyisoprenyl-phosphate glycosyltransferase
MLPNLTIVVPCFNEEESLFTTGEVLIDCIEQMVTKKKVGQQSKILFIDDGSTDKTWLIMNTLSMQFVNRVSGIKLSRNVGHQNALIAGLEHVTTEICISIDADLQDDVRVIDEMVMYYHQGYQIVYGVKKDRSSDSWFKRQTAKLFYRLIGRLGVETVDNHADFRLLGEKALKALMSFREVNIYLRGVVPLVGFPATSVYYDRSARFAGKSKYPLQKMLALAVKGITSLSVVPLRMIAMFGFFTSLLSAILSVWVILNKLLRHPVQGWSSMTLLIFFMGGVQILALGVLGEYIGSIYLEVKQRPKYFIEARTKQ